MNATAAHLVQLLYVSRADDQTSDADVEAILDAATTHNLRDRITGALLAYGGYFLQVLEGPSEQVEACLRRIMADSRHREVNILQRQALPEREFGPWAMRRVAMDSAAEPAVAGFLEGLGRQVGTGDVRLALGLLRRLAEKSPPERR